VSQRAWPALACLFALTSCGSAESPKWLVVAATRDSLEPAIEAVKPLQKNWANATVVLSADCPNLKAGLYLAVVEIAADRSAADASAGRLKSSVPDAYVRACEPKAASRMQFGIPAVDPSVFRVPATAVNWDSGDRLSDVKAAGSGYVWTKRWYEPAPEDPLEGRRAAVYFFEKDPRQAKELAANCVDPAVHVTSGVAALACVRENAGENLFHETRVVEVATGRVLKTVPRCRDPKLLSRTELSCQAESAGADGQLKLTAKRIPLQ